ncbi:MAG: M48 family metallopeptidase [Elusimicrobiota bacterium]
MFKRLILIFLPVIFLCGCAMIYNPATEKRDIVFIDTQNEVSLGKMINSNISKDFKISQDKTLNQRVKEIGEKIVVVCDRQDLDYQFGVVEDEELNAFSLPGGFIYANSGLLKAANDDELAGVMAHEIGHVVARHSIKHLQTALGFNIVMAIAFNQSSAVDVYNAVNVVYNLMSLGYSREDERQADKLAVIYAFKAEYNPRGILTFFAKLKEEEKKDGGVNVPVFMRSHPAIEERIKNIEKEIKAVEHPQPKSAPPVANSSQKPPPPAGRYWRHQKQPRTGQFCSKSKR